MKSLNQALFRVAVTKYEQIRKLSTDDPTRASEFAELAHKSNGRVDSVSFLAKCSEAASWRWLGKHEAAVVALAEALEKLDGEAEQMPRTIRKYGFSELCHALVSGLSVPEVEFTAIDAVLERLTQFAQDFDLHPSQLWEVHIRRHMMTGDIDAAERWIERLIPHVNYTNALLHGQDCPVCLLGTIAAIRGPNADVDALKQMLRPVFANEHDYPGEDMAVLEKRYENGRPGQCNDGLQMCATSLGRALLHAGDFASASTYIDQARAHGPGGFFLLPEIASLELALATETEVETHADHLAPLAATHEDIDQKFLAELRLLSACAVLDRDSTELLAAARDSAKRLDMRVGTSRYSDQLEGQLEHGPDFLKGTNT